MSKHESSPNVTTYLLTTVNVKPNQMNNDIRTNIKENLIKKLTKPKPKCFAHYGVVMEVHDIFYAPDARIIAEDPSCSATFNVKFLCTLCHPLNNTTIIGNIQGINQMVIYIVNGPLDILINTGRNINPKVFKFNTKIRQWTVQKEVSDASTEDVKRQIIKIGTHVKVKILEKKITDKSERVVCLGYLENIATDEEARDALNKQRNTSLVEDMDQYISKNKYFNDENNFNNENNENNGNSENDLNNEEYSEDE